MGVELLTAHPADVRLDRSIAVDVDAGVPAGQSPLGPPQLDSRHHLVLGTVAPQPRAGRLLGRTRRQLGEPAIQRAERALEILEAPSLDARAGADGQGPGLFPRRRRGQKL